MNINMSFKINGRDVNGYKECYLTQTYQEGRTWDHELRDIINKEISPNDVILECDAHVGSHTFQFSSKSKKVYALEAYNETYNFLCNNVSCLDNVVPINTALSSENKEVKINFISENKLLRTPISWDHAYVPHGIGIIDNDRLWSTTIVAPRPHYICTDTLDSITNRLPEPITCIKIKYNSYNIVRKSENFIKKQKPKFIIEKDYDEVLVGSFLVNTLGCYEQENHPMWNVYTPKL